MGLTLDHHTVRMPETVDHVVAISGSDQGSLLWSCGLSGNEQIPIVFLQQVGTLRSDVGRTRNPNTLAFIRVDTQISFAGG